MNVQHNGVLITPMKDVEPVLVKICVQMSRIRQCLSAPNGLSLANSLIKGTDTEYHVATFKDKYSSQQSISGHSNSLGPKYWQNFMKRNGHELECKRGQKYSVDRENWCTYQNFSQMYTNVYD